TYAVDEPGLGSAIPQTIHRPEDARLQIQYRGTESRESGSSTPATDARLGAGRIIGNNSDLIEPGGEIKSRLFTNHRTTLSARVDSHYVLPQSLLPDISPVVHPLEIDLPHGLVHSRDRAPQIVARRRHA